MRILITGFIAFVIWSVFSAWIYNDKLLPVLKAPDPVPVVIPEKTSAADSLAKILEAMPKKLTIYFEFGKTKFNIDQQTDSNIAEIKAWLEKYPGSKLSVTGHTCIVGTAEYNQELGMKRAEVVQEYLEAKGFAGERMVVGSKGETEPAADYLKDEDRAKNRRTEVSIKME